MAENKNSGVSKDSSGKSASKETSTTSQEAAQTKPVKIKCDVNTSCDDTRKWGT